MTVPPARLRSAAELFRGRFPGEPALFKAPGRVNLIGEHTDYNSGFVMPAAVDAFAWAAVAARPDQILRVFSREFDEQVDLDLARIEPGPTSHWSDYVRGVAGALRDEGVALSGADLVVAGDLPLGGGLSSSAALEVASALALLHAGGARLDPERVAFAAQRAEHDYVGVRCGIMDQFAACFGREGHAMLLDCRSLERRWLPLPPEVRLVLCDSGVRHQLARGEYNRRRADCEAAAKALGVATLRDAQMPQAAALSGTLARRARHVVGENDRTLRAADALEGGDLRAFGRLMAQSHASLRDDYEVSCPELDALVRAAEEVPGVYGARMMGGGFGGSTINLVAADRAEEFCGRIRRLFPRSRPQAFSTAGCAGPA